MLQDWPAQSEALAVEFLQILRVHAVAFMEDENAPRAPLTEAWPHHPHRRGPEPQNQGQVSTFPLNSIRSIAKSCRPFFGDNSN